MASTLTYTTAVKNAKLDAITTACGTSPLLRIYDGTPPASANAALSGNTKLAELSMSATPFAAASGGVLTANAITTDSSADATGTASFYRIYKSDGTTVILQGGVSTASADLNLNTTSIVAAAAVAVTALTITEAN